MPLLLRLRNLRVWQLCLVTGLGTSLLYLLLLTQQYAGDGMRWYAMISGATPLQLGGTNHLLYPPLARFYFLITHEGLGFPASFALAQSMNAWFGGAGVACFTYTLFQFTRRWPLAFAGAAVLACSRAYSLHATDMTEPMPGMFLSLLAFALAAAYVTRPEPRRRLIVAAGVSAGLAACIYQAYVLTVISLGALLFICQAGRPRRQRLADVLLCTVVAGGVALGAYLIAFLISGNARTLGEALQQSLKTENESTQGVYAELSLRRVGVLIFGLGEALFGLRAIGGQSTLFFSQGLTPGVVWTVGLVAWSVGVVALIAAPAIFRRVQLSDADRRSVAAGVIGALPHLFLLVYWGARYSKLWMAPLALLLIALAVLVRAALNQASHAARLTRWAFAFGLVTPVLVAGVAFNMVFDRTMPNPGMQDTLDISARVTPRDLIISEWGGTPYPVPAQPQSITLVGAAFEAQLDVDTLHAQIQRDVEAAVRRGGAVYFYGLLDLPPEEWDVSLGQRMQLPYTFLAEYRERAAPIMTLRLRTSFDTPLHLWALQTP